MKQYAVSKNKWPFKKTIGDAHLVALILLLQQPVVCEHINILITKPVGM